MAAYYVHLGRLALFRRDGVFHVGTSRPWADDRRQHRVRGPVWSRQRHYWPLADQNRARGSGQESGAIPIGSMYAIYGNINHQYTPNVSIYTIHGSYGIYVLLF